MDSIGMFRVVWYSQRVDVNFVIKSNYQMLQEHKSNLEEIFLVLYVTMLLPTFLVCLYCYCVYLEDEIYVI